MLRPDFGCARATPKIPAGHIEHAMVAALQIDDSLVSPIFPAKPRAVQGVFDIRSLCTRDPLLFCYSLLEKCRGVHTSKDNRSKAEIAQLSLNDLCRKSSVG
jgi:hypothetical protein